MSLTQTINCHQQSSCGGSQVSCLMLMMCKDADASEGKPRTEDAHSGRLRAVSTEKTVGFIKIG